MDDSAMSTHLDGNRPSFKRLLSLLGSGLALVGVVFVGFRLSHYWVSLDVSRFSPSAWWGIAMLAMVYCFSTILLALAWWCLLRHFGTTLAVLTTVRIYCVTQLAKYLPGNVFHLAGRQALGMSAGIPAGVMTKSMIWELVLIAGAGSLFLGLSLPLVLPGFSQAGGVFLMALVSALVVWALLAFTSRQVAWALILQIVFLLLSGAVFLAIVGIVADAESMAMQHGPAILGAYVIAWLVGLVTPGAPAGVGVREMILLALLKGVVAEGDLLVATLLGRLVTVSGDLLIFLVSQFILPRFGRIARGYA